MSYNYFDASCKMLELAANRRSNFVKIAKEDIKQLKDFSKEYENDITLEIKESADRNYMLCRYKINK